MCSPLFFFFLSISAKTGQSRKHSLTLISPSTWATALALSGTKMFSLWQPTLERNQIMSKDLWHIDGYKIVTKCQKHVYVTCLLPFWIQAHSVLTQSFMEPCPVIDHMEIWSLW